MTKEHKKMEKSLEKILDKMAQIEIEMHKHHQMHGGAVGFVDAFKNLGKTIKSGFEDKIINPIKSGVEEKIINPIKENIPKSEKDILDKIPDKIKNDPKFAKTIDFITKKKGGLASSLLHNALPATTSAIVGGLSGLASGNPFVGMAGSAAGGYAGKELADYVGKKTGVGIKGRGNGYPTTLNEQNEINTRENRERQERRRGKGMSGCGENFPDTIKRLKTEADSGDITAVRNLKRLGQSYTPKTTGGGIRKKRKSKKYYSSSSDSDSDFRPKRRTNNSALQQLIVANRDKEEKELNKSQLMINRHMAEEIKAIRGMQGPPPKFSGYGIKKLVGTKRGNRARGDIVAEVMKKEGLSLSQASKYVKEHDMY